MLKRLLRLVIFAAIASAVASAVKVVSQQGPSNNAADDASAPGSVDTWPDVPRNPDAA
jgi:hypothetical protein